MKIHLKILGRKAIWCFFVLFLLFNFKPLLWNGMIWRKVKNSSEMLVSGILLSLSRGARPALIKGSGGRAMPSHMEECCSLRMS